MLIGDERKAYLRLFLNSRPLLNSGFVDNVLFGRVIRHVLNTRPMFLKWCIAKLVCRWFKSLPSKFPCDINLCRRAIWLSEIYSLGFTLWELGILKNYSNLFLQCKALTPMLLVIGSPP